MKWIKRYIVIFFVFISIFVVAGCSSRRDCRDTSDRFMEAMIAQDYQALEELSQNSKKVDRIVVNYEDDLVVKALLSNTAYEVEDSKIRSEEATIMYAVTLPDYNKSENEAPNTIAEYCDMVGSNSYDRTTLKVVVKLARKDGNWSVVNYEKTLPSFYDKLYGSSKKIGYVNIPGNVLSGEWVGTLEDNSNSYEAFSTHMEYKMTLQNEIKSDVYFSLYSGETLVNEAVIKVAGQEIIYSYDCKANAFIPSGEYKLIVRDSHKRTLYEAKCEIEAIDYDSLIDECDFEGAKEGVYSADATEIILNLKLSKALSMKVNVNYYYNDALVKTDEYTLEDLAVSAITSQEMDLMYMPVGEYRIEFCDVNGTVMYKFECEVILDKVLAYACEWDYNLKWYHNADDDYATCIVYFNQDIDATLTYDVLFDDRKPVYSGEVEATNEAVITFALDDIWSDDIYYDHLYTLHVYGPDGFEFIASDFFVEWN